MEGAAYVRNYFRRGNDSFEHRYDCVRADALESEGLMGEKLKAARQAAGMTQGQLAEAIGCRVKDISRWETVT